MEHDFLGRSNRKCSGATEHFVKGRSIFPDGIFQMEIRIPFKRPATDFRGGFR